MRKFLGVCSLALALVSSNAMADFLGLYVGGGVWDHDPSGTFASTQVGSTPIDMTTTAGFTNESEAYVWAAFDHFIPLVPNVRVEMTSLGHTGNVTGAVNFGGASVSGNSTVVLDSTDAILYYRLLDNWVNLDIGLDLRKLDGEFTIGSSSATISESIPMAYLAAQFDLPFTGLSVGADYLKGSDYDDIRLRGIYEIGVIGFEVGYRTSNIKLDRVDGINADLEFTGLMLGAFLHF